MRAVLVWSAVAVVAAATGCSSDPSEGYSFKSSYRDDIRTIAVPIFENNTYEHGLELDLTEAIIKEIHRSTPWKVTSREMAETTLTGAITDADLRKLSTQRRSGLVQELAVDLAVRFEWREVRSGQVLVARRNFRAAEPFVPSRGAQERLEAGQRSAIDQMAKDLVAELRSSW